jgi:hypothetical protein
MIRKRLSLSPTAAIALIALFFALGGSAFAVGERIGQQREGQTDSFVGVSRQNFQDALHRASVQAARFQRGRYKGREFDVIRTSVTISNPHITAYRVVITPR